MNGLVLAVLSAFSLLTFTASADADPTVKAIEFIGMPAPVTADEMTDVYSKTRMRVIYGNGRSQTYNPSYHELMGTNDSVAGHTVGGLCDYPEHPLTDTEGQIASDSPDGNSLMVRFADRGKRPRIFVHHEQLPAFRRGSREETTLDRTGNSSLQS